VTSTLGFPTVGNKLISPGAPLWEFPFLPIHSPCTSRSAHVSSNWFLSRRFRFSEARQQPVPSDKYSQYNDEESQYPQANQYCCLHNGWKYCLLLPAHSGSQRRWYI